jgi:hypothetical protein
MTLRPRLWLAVLLVALPATADAEPHSCAMSTLAYAYGTGDRFGGAAWLHQCGLLAPSPVAPRAMVPPALVPAVAAAARVLRATGCSAASARGAPCNVATAAASRAPAAARSVRARARRRGRSTMNLLTKTQRPASFVQILGFFIRGTRGRLARCLGGPRASPQPPMRLGVQGTPPSGPPSAAGFCVC